MLTEFQKVGLLPTLLGACAYGDEKRVTQLIHSGADFNDVLPDGTGALHLAAMYKHVKILQLLLAHGVSAGARQQNGQTPLHIAAEGGCWKCANVLLDAGRADVNATDRAAMTPLHVAAVTGRVYMVEKLAAGGAGLDMRDCHGRTALWCAARYGQLTVAWVLVKQGADVRVADDTFATPLHVAARYGFVDLAKVLRAAAEKWDDDGHAPTGVVVVPGSSHMLR